MKVRYSILAFIFGTLLITSCKKEGCTDQNALNYDADAKQENYTCDFSQITFYSTAATYFGVPITSIKVTWNGSPIGYLTVRFTTAPGNCSATGTRSVRPGSGDSKDWEAEVELEDGSIIYVSGTVQPDPNLDCVKVNVTG